MKTDPVLQLVILELLKVVETVLHKRGIDFDLVGSSAQAGEEDRGYPVVVTR